MITTKWHGRGKWAYPMNTFIPLTGYSRFKKKKKETQGKKIKKKRKETGKFGKLVVRTILQ